MRLVLVRHLWGTTGKWETLLPRIREAGYEVIESALPPAVDRQELRALLKSFGFGYIAQIFTAGKTVAAHLESFKTQIEEAAELEPLIVNSHSGVDTWEEAKASEFFEGAVQIEAQSGGAVAHETHRGRILFNSRDTVRMLERFPALKLCCDFSHWVCVSERLLEDQMEAVQLAATRCIHLHARVGYEQGPQVPHPGAMEYASHLEAHESWWRLVWEAQLGNGDAVSTLTPEFGPPPYLHTLPFTNQPVADLWNVCDWQANRQRAQFQAWQTGLGE
ncbi:MAG TPA: TIM barrel protein [Clostridia bacterium]|nr:TIM barrel protein [Clostridia bacterium]